jgi:predicted DNA-binding transcriptional regulator YafY
MARNTEVVRQWEILRSIDAATQGVTVTKLAAERGVRERTIRRDLDALGRAATRGRYLRTRSKPPKMLAHAS